MTNQQRMRALLDQRAQKTTRMDGHSKKTNREVLRRWIGPKQSGHMRGRWSGK